MICTFCGSENPAGNRFCGMCGVRLERRKLERRTQERGSISCAECGYLNESKFKFCGMCGAKIDRRMHERRGGGDVVRAFATANSQLPAPEPHRPSARPEPEITRRSAMISAAAALAEREAPDSSVAPRRELPEIRTSVSGPSFLGLSDPPAADYLLEEERSSHRGLRALLLLIVLAAIVGLILVQYRSSMNARPKSAQPPNPGPATVPQSMRGINPATGPDKSLQIAVAAHSLQPAVASVAQAANASVQGNAGLIAKKNTENDEDGAHATAKPDPPAAAAKPDSPAAATNEQPSPTLVKAQKYLHGRGVRQNCEQGLIYLRAAARESDPQAAVQMGALYSSGLCVARDRVKAYEWFSTARDMQPANRWISRNLNELWAQMSPQERRQIHQ